MHLRFAHAVAMLAALSSAAAAQEPAPARKDAPIAPDWKAPLPFAPDGASVSAGRLVIARIADSAIELASAPLDASGVALPPEGSESAWEPSVRHSVGGGTPDLVAGAGSAWYSWSAATRQLHRAVSESTEAPAASLGTWVAPSAAELPFARVEAIVELKDHVFVVGGGETESFVASTPLSTWGNDAKWILSAPVPDGRHKMGVASVNGSLLLAGGIVAHPSGGAFPPIETFAASAEEGGVLTAWRAPSALRLPLGPGPANATGINGVLALMGDLQPAESPVQLQIAIDRHDGTFVPWRAVALESPALENAFVVADAANHRAIVLGGRLAASGQPNSEARAWRMPASAGLVGKKNEELSVARMESSPGQASNEDRPRMKAGLARAAHEGKFLIVMVIGPEDADERNRMMLRNFLRRQSVMTMFADVVVAQAWPEEIADVQKLSGSTEIPQVVLIDKEGAFAGVAPGVPSDEELYRLMQPVWAPKNPEPAP